MGSLDLVRQTIYEMENFEFKPAWKLTLCHILLVSEGLGKHTTWGP